MTVEPVLPTRLARISGDQTLVIIPTYNEHDNVEKLIPAILEQLPKAQVWIVDDSSPDRTGELVDEFSRRDERIKCFHRPAKSGLGTAYAESFYRVLHDEIGVDFSFIVEMDADFSHDPAMLPDLLERAETADLVLGSRYVPGGTTPDWSMFRRAISRVGNIVARVLLGLHVQDATTGYRVYTRKALETIHLEGVSLRGYGFQIETVYQCQRAGLSIAEAPIRFMDRSHGHSKMSKAIVVEALWYVVRRRLVDFHLPLFAANKPDDVAAHNDPAESTN